MIHLKLNLVKTTRYDYEEVFTLFQLPESERMQVGNLLCICCTNFSCCVTKLCSGLSENGCWRNELVKKEKIPEICCQVGLARCIVIVELYKNSFF